MLLLRLMKDETRNQQVAKFTLSGDGVAKFNACQMFLLYSMHYTLTAHLHQQLYGSDQFEIQIEPGYSANLNRTLRTSSKRITNHRQTRSLWSGLCVQRIKAQREIKIEWASSAFDEAKKQQTLKPNVRFYLHCAIVCTVRFYPNCKVLFAL